MKRCAIYTRKSTDEGLDQEFNSLEAQREACEAYIKSQKQEGWQVVRDPFDDGGYSGGSMERPALHNLLAAIKDNRVDIVVVYKVDRLTRSLTDFAKMIEVFDEAGVSFVSVTQQFNTTSSMGRLTLNVLLSFAQFEREVTAERIRDKIAASKKKGIWMGGSVPLGYDVKDRALVINEKEAETVRYLFNRYLEVNGLEDLRRDANRRGIRTKLKIHKDGTTRGGRPFGRGGLAHLLKNPIYAGYIAHKEKRYAGRHDGIINRETFEAVQRKLKRPRSPGVPCKSSSPLLLTGLLFDERGRRFTPVHTRNHGRRYYYYVSSQTNASQKDSCRKVQRLPGREFDRRFIRAFAKALANDPAIDDIVQANSIEDVKSLESNRTQLASSVSNGAEADKRNIVGQLLRNIHVHSLQTVVELNCRALTTELCAKPISNQTSECTLKLSLPIGFSDCGTGSAYAVGLQTNTPKYENFAKPIAKAHRWLELLSSGKVQSIRQIACSEGIDEGDVSRFLNLAFLAPNLTQRILEGTLDVEPSQSLLRLICGLPAEWNEQTEALATV